MIKKSLALFLALMLSYSLNARELVFAPDHYPPYIIVEKSNKAKGIYPDVLDMFVKEYPEYSISYQFFPRKRAVFMMRQGNVVDMALEATIFVKEGTEIFYDLSEIVAHTKDVVITRADSNFVYKQPEDLWGKIVAVKRGYLYGVFDQYQKEGKLRYEVLNEHTQAIKFLSLGRADALFGNIHVHPYHIKELGLELSDFNFSEKALFEFDLAFQVRKGIGVLPKLNKFIRKIKSDGTLDKIIDKYIK